MSNEETRLNMEQEDQEQEYQGGDEEGLKGQVSEPDIHLVICVHGFLGHSGHLRYIGSQLDRLEHLRGLTDRVIIFNSTINHVGQTMDGIDLCGFRLVKEVAQLLADTRKQSPSAHLKMSMIGYSLGGCIARFALGILDEQGLLDDIELLNFVTFASPHLGARKSPHPFGLLYNWCAPKLCSRTGWQVMLEDNDHDFEGPLLLHMSEKDTSFYRVLEKFSNRMVYANALFDRTVGYCSAALVCANPYRSNPPEVISPTYPHIVRPTSSEIHPPKERTFLGMVVYFILLALLLPLLFLLVVVLLFFGSISQVRLVSGKNKNSDYQELNYIKAKKAQKVPKNPLEIRREMAENLNDLNWQKFDVYLDTMNSHGPIIVRSTSSFFKENGHDVIQHMVDHFHL